jgi:hypothetical protein
MSMVYVCDAAGQAPFRKTAGLRVFSMGQYRGVGQISIPDEYASRPFQWGGSITDAEPLAVAILADCLRISEVDSPEASSGGGSSRDLVSSLRQKFAEEFICTADPDEVFSVDWLEVLAWMDVQVHGELGAVAALFTRIRNFDNLLRAAFEDGGSSRVHRVSREIWEAWNVEAFAQLCLVNSKLTGKQLRRFIDHFIDLKFKLYMLAEVDVPTYASAKQKWGLDRDHPDATPHGFAKQLSEEVTLIVKSRAIWESIMNLVYWYATGAELSGVQAVDEDGVSYKSKQKKFFPWVAEQPLWASLATFEPLVGKLDQLRASEIHRFSRVRSNFTQMTLDPIDQCVELVNTVLTYILDQFVAAIALRYSATYDASQKTPITLG